MVIALDHKQRRLIDAWLARAAVADGDEYGRFMAAWVAFNAFCYAGFASLASRRRPDLADAKGLNGLEGKVKASGTLELRSHGRFRLQIDDPGRIRIDIRDRYTEDIIFAQFAQRFQPIFESWMKASSFRVIHDGFLKTIYRQHGTYVINMLRVSDYDQKRPLDELIHQGIVAAVTNPGDLSQLVDVLYQVRCNVFHGEKAPGDPNDDRIVRAARPLVVELLKQALDCNEPL